MNNKVKIGLYYMCALLTVVILCIGKVIMSPLLMTLSVINTILVVIASILLFKKTLNNFKVITPIIYIIFFIIMTIVIILFDQKADMYYMLNSYYVIFISIAYMVLNIYMLLSFEKRKK